MEEEEGGDPDGGREPDAAGEQTEDGPARPRETALAAADLAQAEDAEHDGRQAGQPADE